MTTLVVLPRFPNERTGTGQRSRLLVDGALAAGDTHVVLLDGRVADLPLETIQGVKTLVARQSERLTPSGFFARRLGGALRLVAPATSYAPDPELHTYLSGVIKENSVKSVIFRYAPLYCAAGITAKNDLRVIVDVDDRDDQKYETRLMRLLGVRIAKSWICRWLLGRLATHLKIRLSSASHVLFATQEDVWRLNRAQVSVLPNVAFVAPQGKVSLPSSNGPRILFVGIYNHLPNKEGVSWFLRHCWPDIIAHCPTATLRVVGRGNWAEMNGHFPNLTGVAFVGEVADLAPEYANARLAISPVREGGGSKIKVIEAASFGRPVMATQHSLRGFENAEANAFGVADDAADFAQGCLRYLTYPQRADEAGAALRDWQQSHYSATAFINKVKTAIQAKD